jgi:hypothetical protein
VSGFTFLGAMGAEEKEGAGGRGSAIAAFSMLRGHIDDVGGHI